MMLPDWSLEIFETLPSTQDEIRERLKQKQGSLPPPEGLLVQAIEQTAGRGRHGRLWYSPPGNLYLSFLLKPQISANQCGSLSLVLSLSVLSALENSRGLDKSKASLTLKWPNDILLNGKKCAGILLETEVDTSGRIENVIAGIGVNLSSAPPETGTSLSEVTNPPPSLSELRGEILAAIAGDYAIWRLQGFAPFHSRWQENSYPLDSILTVGIDKKRHTGRFKGIDPDGNLLLLSEEGKTLVFPSGEILQ